MIDIEEQLTIHEGIRQFPYRCTAGKLTIGIGRNIEARGISEKEARYLLRNDIAACTRDLKDIFPGYKKLPVGVQNTLIDMRFQLGYGKFRKFKKMIKAVKKRDFKEMVTQMIDSSWYRQVPGRANYLILLVQGKG